jgi:hypothetical protein
LENFLQVALRIDLVWLIGNLGEDRVHLTQDKNTGGVKSTIQVNRADEGFKGIGQCGSALAASTGLLAASHHDETAEIKSQSAISEGWAGYDAGSELCQLPLTKVRKHTEEMLCDSDLNHGITKKFQTLIVEGVVFPL